MNRHDFLCGVAGTLVAWPAAAPAQDAAAGRGVAAKPIETTPGIDPDLKAHGAIFERKVHKVSDQVYSAVGWSGCNAIMVVGDDGVIIVDTGDNLQAAREVATEFRKITDKPVRAVVYTCFHIDHISGVKGFVSAEDVAAGRIEVVAHDTLLGNVVNQAGAVTPILGIRTAYNFGIFLDGPDIADMNNGTGPRIRADREVSFIAPTRTFADKLDLIVAG